VKFSQCVDNRTLRNAVRLNKGDLVTVTSLYDVDPRSIRNLPFKGGKHGGTMSLFFVLMDCDPGTFGEKYVCRNASCIPVPSHKGKYDTLPQCEEACGSEEVTTGGSHGKAARRFEVEPQSQTLHVPISDKVETIAPKVGNEVVSPEIGRLSVTWKDCGDSQTHAKITAVHPDIVKLGSITTLEGYGFLDKAFQSGNFSIKMVAGILGITLVDVSSDMCQVQKPVSTLLDLIHISWDGLECPLKAGNQSLKMRLRLNELLPPQIAQTTTTVLARSATGEKIFCLEVFTEGYRLSHLQSGNSADFLV